LIKIFVSDSMDLSSFNILWWALKHASFLQSAYRLFMVIQG